MRQTILTNSIKWALARPNARWELSAFSNHMGVSPDAWRPISIL